VTLRLPFPPAGDALSRVLVVGCHSDDIEIGCGGTLLALTRARPDLEVTWVVLGANDARADEARASAERFLAAAPRSTIAVHGFRDGYFPYDGAQVKDVFESLKPVDPQLVLTHTRHDLHQDHRLVCELTWNTWRDHLILEYEIPKYDGDLGRPNVFVHLDDATVDRKVAHVLEHFPSQTVRRWFTDDLFRSLLRIRGMESNAPSGFAEGFYVRKLVFEP
jgi:LmbE family N-acetylglucosaminyl deacetylase